LVVAGGVGANLRLRAALSALLRDMGGELFHPRPQFCTDNGAMIAHVGCLRMAAGQSDGGQAVALRPRWPLSELEPPA
jgi:N6-L-threonylcarbamoyladenine synthase